MFGNVVVDRVLSSDIREIRIFRATRRSRTTCGEYAAKLKFFCDVRNSHGLRDAMHGVDFVPRGGVEASAEL
jgi:hypothetical protein